MFSWWLDVIWELPTFAESKSQPTNAEPTLQMPSQQLDTHDNRLCVLLYMQSSYDDGTPPVTAHSTAPAAATLNIKLCTQKLEG